MSIRLSAMALVLAAFSAASCTKEISTSPSNPLPIVISGTVRNTLEAPLGGVTVTATSAGTSVQGFTDVDGRFTLPGLRAGSQEYITVTAQLGGYVKLSRVVEPPLVHQTVNLKLATLSALPIDSSASAQLLPSDVADYVAEPYESDYSWNTKYFSFSTGAEDLVVELTWEHSGNASLQMWWQNTSFASQAAGDKQVIVLPKNRSGVLLIGQPFQAQQLTSATNFTLETRRVTSGNER